MTRDAPPAAFEKDRRWTADDGTELAYTTLGAGDRPPLAFANGWSCGDSYWRWIIPPLVERGHPCLVFDTRGHGQSGLPREPGRGARHLRSEDVSVERLACDLRGLVDHLDWEGVVVVGHSMGVQTALEAGGAGDPRLAALVAVAGAYENPLRTFYGLPFGLAERGFPVIREVVRRVPEVLTPIWSTIDDNEFGLRAAQAVRAAGPKVTREGLGPYLLHMASCRPDVLFAMIDGMRAHSAAATLPELEVPLLVLAGSRDVFTPPSCSERMHELAADAEIIWFEDGHHTLPIEEPEAIVEAIDDFVDRRVRSAGRSSGTASRP